ncbi:hypothetical protein ACV348_33075, partial [Pseudomonas aeruginosa]
SCWASNTGAAWPVTCDSRWLVSSAQQEIVCAMTTVTDLGQLQSAEDRDALFHEALQVNQPTGARMPGWRIRPPVDWLTCSASWNSASRASAD